MSKGAKIFNKPFVSFILYDTFAVLIFKQDYKNKA